MRKLNKDEILKPKLNYKYLNISVKPPSSSRVVNPSLSSLVNPAFLVLVLGFFRSISLCATFKSPHTITGFTASSFFRCSLGIIYHYKVIPNQLTLTKPCIFWCVSSPQMRLFVKCRRI